MCAHARAAWCARRRVNLNRNRELELPAPPQKKKKEKKKRRGWGQRCRQPIVISSQRLFPSLLFLVCLTRVEILRLGEGNWTGVGWKRLAVYKCIRRNFKTLLLAIERL